MRGGDEEGQPQFADDWERLANEKRRAAEILFRSRQFGSAYYEAGIALECMLKAKIMRKEGLNIWPDRSCRKDLYTHDLARLLKLAGLHDRMVAEAKKVTDIGIAWSVAKQWTVDARYARKVRLRDARDIVEAVSPTGKGLLKWIISV
ncbi:hypothetical protein [Azospirillum formosense]|uniref:hypothetical protein n=1 Tax=Azospirillum formosense TaxID=861533 RepID=UPI00338FEB3E